MKAIAKQKVYYLLVFGLVLILSLLSLLRLNHLRFDYDFEAFFPNEDHELELYEKYRQNFEYDNEFVLLALENKEGIFKKDFLVKVDSLTKSLSRLQYVKEVTSPSNLKTTDLSGLVPLQKKVMHVEDETLYKSDSIAIYSNPLLVGSYFPENACSLSIFIKTDDLLSKKKCDTLSKNIERCLANFQFDEVHLAGRIFAQNVYLSTVQKEFFIFLSLAFVIIVIFLWFSFRSIYGILVPVTIVLVSILWTLGIMNFMGKPIDIMCTMLPTMIFIAGMSDVVHFFSKYFEELAKRKAREKIYPLILKEVGFPTLLTLITTVVGFLSLLFSSIKPIREFGIYTSIGVCIAFILTYTLLPAILYFFTPRKMILQHQEHGRTNTILRKVLFVIFRNQKMILLVTVLILIISGLGISKIKVNNILLEDLSDKVKIKQDFIFFDKNYSGARPLEIQIDLKGNRTVWDYEVLKEINKLESFVKQEYQAGFLVSPAALIRSIYFNQNQDSLSDFPDKENCKEIVNYLKANFSAKEFKRFISNDAQHTRISGKMRDVGSIKTGEHNKHLSDFVNSQINPEMLNITITGAAHLLDRNNEYMVSNMTQGFAFSIVLIGILTFFLHRSWRMVLVFILPNLIPLIIISGIMGFAGIELKAATSLVFSIAFGIATDDTIHFISRLKIELDYGKNILYAFKRTYFETGKPIVLTTFILLGGFISLTLSDFQSTFYFGFLICITIIVAVLADLFLLPVLLFWLYGKRSKK